VSIAESENAPAVPGTAGLPVLRLLPAPVSEPPYDDELPAGAGLRLVASGNTVLASPATLPVPAAAPAAGALPVPLRLLPGPPAPPAPVDEAGGEPARTPLAQLPPARPFAQALVQRLLEVLAGLRPLGQLQRDTTLELYDELERTVSDRPRATGPRPTRRDVRSLHLQEREDGVAEACATVRRGGRVVALAFRLEGRSGSWRCTELLGV
jgi:hypothetical protein